MVFSIISKMEELRARLLMTFTPRSMRAFEMVETR
jgi:hypothetical protein